MALPEKVIEQLGRDPSGTQGWALGALLFSGGMLFLACVVYAGLAFGYAPYLQGQLTDAQHKVSALDTSISASDQTQLIDFYSQISNLQTLLNNHVLSSQFFTWLEGNTEANVSYSSLTLSSQNQVSLVGAATTEADVNQQIALFENSPQVSTVGVSSVGSPLTPGGFWVFNLTLTMLPSVFKASATH